MLLSFSSSSDLISVDGSIRIVSVGDEFSAEALLSPGSQEYRDKERLYQGKVHALRDNE